MERLVSSLSFFGLVNGRASHSAIFKFFPVMESLLLAGLTEMRPSSILLKRSNCLHKKYVSTVMDILNHFDQIQSNLYPAEKKRLGQLTQNPLQHREGREP